MAEIRMIRNDVASDTAMIVSTTPVSLVPRILIPDRTVSASTARMTSPR